jgi:hypothetical protein
VREQDQGGVGRAGEKLSGAGCPLSPAGSSRRSQVPGTCKPSPAPAAPGSRLLWESWLRSRLGRRLVPALPPWPTNGEQPVALVLPGLSLPPPRCLFFSCPSRCQHSQALLWSWTVNSWKKCSTPVETTSNHTLSRVLGALTTTWACSHLPAI